MKFQCLYCGHYYEEKLMAYMSSVPRCPICKETQLIKQINESPDVKVDYYKGDDPFPETKQPEKNDYEDNSYNDYILMD